MTLKISATWLSKPTGVKAPELAATWGTCEISVNGRTITLVEDALTGLSRRFVVGSLYPLAEWIAFNWWLLQYDLRAADFLGRNLQVVAGKGSFSRQRSHNISEAGDGFAWPSMWIAPSGAGSLVRWDTSDGNGRVRFVSAGTASVDTGELMETLARFVDQVLDRLDEDEIQDTPLNKEWNAIRVADSEEAEFCRSAASLGLDPFQVDPDISKAIIEAHDFLEPRDFEVLMNSAEPTRLGMDIEWIQRAAAKLLDCPIKSPTIGRLRSLSGSFGPIRPGAPWKAGYEAAGVVRDLLEIAVDERLELDSYVPVSFLEGPDSGLMAVAGCWSDFSSVVLGARRGIAGQRFVQARSIWRFVNQSSDNNTILIGHGHAAFQQAERAFAAELLAPARAIKDQLDEGLSDSEVIAERFGVAVSVIDNQLDNQLS